MPSFDVVVESRCSNSIRARQLEAIFDVPRTEHSRLQFSGTLPIEDREWSVGLIVGPSGCGKSTILRNVFGGELPLVWQGASVVDDFAGDLSMEEISAACQAVGFNTIPAWLRPYAVLSNGERFRVELARRLLESSGTVVVDEFTSVVDRQVAQIGAHAVQKHVRRAGKRFVAASCHYDIIDWLQPDWVFEPATMSFTWRCLQRRPTIECTIERSGYDAWAEFAPYHYMTANLHRSARIVVLKVGGRPAALAAMLFRPHAKVRNIWGCSRLVTLPDFQGLGLAFALIDCVGAAYAAKGLRVHTYPAHPALIRGFDKSPRWRLRKRPGFCSQASKSDGIGWRAGSRPCAVFEYCGPASREAAEVIY